MSQFKMSLSIICAVYNTKDYLHQALDSILNQTYTDFELIIVDDQSTDGSWEICQEYQRKYSNIALYRNETNRGVSYTWDFAVSKANGEWIYIVDSDDMIHPRLIEYGIEYIQKNSVLDILYVETTSCTDDEIERISWSEDKPIIEEYYGLDFHSKSKIFSLCLAKNFIRKELIHTIDYKWIKQEVPRRYFNDGLFTYMLYRNADRIAKLSGLLLYAHRIRANSTGASLENPRHIIDWMKSEIIALNLLKSWNEIVSYRLLLLSVLSQMQRSYYVMRKNHICELNGYDSPRIVSEFKTYYRMWRSEKKNVEKEELGWNTRYPVFKVSFLIFNLSPIIWYGIIGKPYFELFGLSGVWKKIVVNLVGREKKRNQID